MTAASLALNIYLSNYYLPKRHDIRMVKGYLEREIRESYFGGIARVYSNRIGEGYYYDVNSHYPAAMLKEMPTGDPVYTTEKNLDNIFGFVQAKVIAPSSSRLKRCILPLKSPEGTLTLPRGEFIGTWFSEELKNAIKYGYKVEVIGAYQFTRKADVFKGYVETLYDIKSKSDEKPAKRFVVKLLLNSLYGRMGMNEIYTSVRIVKTDEVDAIEKRENVISTLNFGEHSLIRSKGEIDKELLSLTGEKAKQPLGLEPKRRGVISSIPIASAVTAYARIALSPFLNMEDNECVYTDTDSVVMTKPLAPEFVGSKLGQMKLENKIIEGIFISPKTYAIKVSKSDGKTATIFKAKGYGSKNMTYDIYEAMYRGAPAKMDKEYWIPSLLKGGVQIVTRKFTIKGIFYPLSPYKLLPSPKPTPKPKPNMALKNNPPSDPPIKCTSSQRINVPLTAEVSDRETLYVAIWIGLLLLAFYLGLPLMLVFMIVLLFF